VKPIRDFSKSAKSDHRLRRTKARMRVPHKVNQYATPKFIFTFYLIRECSALKLLQRFALKPEPTKFLGAMLLNAFKNFVVVLLIKNCCN
jgi:hypothetical protein